MSALQSCRNEMYGDTSQLFCPPSSIATYWIPTKCKWNQIILTLVTALTWYEKSIAGRAKLGVRLQITGDRCSLGRCRCRGVGGHWTMFGLMRTAEGGQWTVNTSGGRVAPWSDSVISWQPPVLHHRHGYTLLRSAQCLNSEQRVLECAHCSDC